MSSRFDFSRRPSQPLVGWLLLVSGALALWFALAFESRVASAKVAAMASQQVQAEAEKQLLKPKPVVEPTASELRAALAAIDLKAPWLATLRSIEATTQQPIFLRSMAIDAASNTVKLEAEADSFDDALDYTKALSEEPLLMPAVMLSHDQAVAALGKQVVRFSVAAPWNRP